MEYKILKRIQDKQITVGYQLISKKGVIVNTTKEQVVEAAKLGLLINATYNKNTQSLTGTNNTDLRSLPVIRYTDILGENKFKASSNDKDQSGIKSNHQLVKDYNSKLQILGKSSNLELKLLDDDRVELIDVSNIDNMSSFKIPGFITDIGGYDDNTVGIGDSSFRIYCYYYSPFALSSISKVSSNSDKLVSLVGAFSHLKGVKYLDLSELNTSNVTNMEGMLCSCYSLESLNISDIDASSVISTIFMFGECTRLNSIDLSKFKPRNLKYMHSMFYNCNSLQSINLSGLDTSNVIDMKYMFNGCVSLSDLCISNFDTSKTNDMSFMFCKCEALKGLNLSKFNTSLVGNMERMFYWCKSLEYLNLSGFDTSNVRNMRGMFYKCGSLKYLDLSSFNTKGVLNMHNLFCGCSSLTHLNLSGFHIGEVVNTEGMFNGCRNLEVVICGTENDRVVLHSIYKEDNPFGKAKFLLETGIKH